MMQTNLRDAALNLGFIDAQPVTGHPFDVWRDRLSSIPFGRHLSFEHDPAKISGWPLEEITIWVAIAPTPPTDPWPEGCGEIGGFYMRAQERRARSAAWQDAAVALGYEIKGDAILPERAAAIRAGLGVHGLNGLLIAPNYGSYVDITAFMVRSAPPSNARGPAFDLSPGCGNCGDCVKACPSGAISDEGVNAVICLRSYMNRLDELPQEDYPKMGKRILGCEICQQACPHNDGLKREQPPADMIEYMKLEELLTKPDIAGISKYVRLDETRVKCQAVLAAANMGRKDLLPLVEGLIGSEDEMLDKMARWAAERLG